MATKVALAYKTIKASTSDTLEIYTGRKEKISPLVNEYFEWLETLPHQHLRNNKLGKAIRYSLGQRVKLNEFLNNGEIPLDNNLAENAIRPYVVGRKAWLFCDSQSGAKASTNIYSLVESAKANGKEPHAYLTHIYEKLPFATTLEDIEALLPWNVDLTP